MLGGAEQHRRGQGPAAGHRGQRQRRGRTRRRSAASPTTWPRCGPARATSASWSGASRPLRSAPVVGDTVLRRAARGQEGPQGHDRAAGPLRGPRPEVRRPGGRARRGGGGDRAGRRPQLRRPGDRALHHREGPRLRAGGAARAGPVPPDRRRPVDRAKPAAGRSWTSRLRRGAGRGRRGAVRRGGDHRGHARPDRAGGVREGVPGPGLRRRHRRAARGHLGGRAGPGRAAPGGRGLRDLPQPGLRPGADGRRAAQAGGHLRARPGRRHRRRRAQPQRHVGPVDPPGGAGPADRRAAGRRPAARAVPARRSRSRTARPRSGSRRAPAPAGRARGATRSAAWTCCTARARRTCCWSRSARWRRSAWAPRRCWPSRRSASPWSTRAG